MSPVLEGRHFCAGHDLLIMVPFVGPRPVVIAPEQQHGNPDVRIGHGRRFPGFGVAEQIEEGAIMAFAVADEIHYLKQLRRNAPRVGDATLEHRSHDEELAQAHHCVAEDRQIRQGDDKVREK